MRKIKGLSGILLVILLIFTLSVPALAAPSSTSSTHTKNTVISPQYASPDPPPPGYVGWAIVTAQPSLNVRSGPGSNYPIIGSVLYGDSVYCYSVDSNEWAYIGNGGYVSAYYLVPQ